MTEEKRPVRVRLAPSPTGHTHLGTARTGLYNYLLAQQTGGQFILRIEDTDRRRYVPGAEEELVKGLHWFGLDWDEGPDKGGPYGPYRQSERKEIYQEHAKKLVEMGHAFYCFCTPAELTKVREEQQRRKEPPHYSGVCRNISPEEAQSRVDAGEPHVIRFKSPQTGETTVYDFLRGAITVENRTVDDYILVKSDGWALYHLAAMVDDHLMKITHVFRGSEWLPTLPLHALIIRAFGWEEPIWVHLSLFLKPSGKGKMSKRDSADAAKDGHSIFLKDMRELGYLPEGVANWTALMGWSYDERTEFFTLQDLIDKFSLGKLNPAPAAINFSKLDHFNGLHIRALSSDDLAERLEPYFRDAGLDADLPTLRKIAPIIQERMITLNDGPEIAGFFFRESVQPEPEDLIAKGLTVEQSAEVARRAYQILSAVASLEAAVAEPPMRDLVDEMGMKAAQVFGILRIAVTGQRVSPPLFESMEIIGKQVVLERLQTAITILEGQIEQG